MQRQSNEEFLFLKKKDQNEGKGIVLFSFFLLINLKDTVQEILMYKGT